MKVRVLDPAFEDLIAGRQFYDRQQEGVGSYFFTSLFADIDSLEEHAGIHRIKFGYHRMLASRFPYAIYYRVIGERVVVHRVLDCRRDPKWIRRALEQSG
jgi:hypothetical protein